MTRESNLIIVQCVSIICSMTIFVKIKLHTWIKIYLLKIPCNIVCSDRAVPRVLLALKHNMRKGLLI